MLFWGLNYKKLTILLKLTKCVMSNLLTSYYSQCSEDISRYTEDILCTDSQSTWKCTDTVQEVWIRICYRTQIFGINPSSPGQMADVSCKLQISYFGTKYLKFSTHKCARWVHTEKYAVDSLLHSKNYVCNDRRFTPSTNSCHGVSVLANISIC